MREPWVGVVFGARPGDDLNFRLCFVRGRLVYIYILRTRLVFHDQADRDLDLVAVAGASANLLLAAGGGVAGGTSCLWSMVASIHDDLARRMAVLSACGAGARRKYRLLAISAIPRTLGGVKPGRTSAAADGSQSRGVVRLAAILDALDPIGEHVARARAADLVSAQPEVLEPRNAVECTLLDLAHPVAVEEEVAKVAGVQHARAQRRDAIVAHRKGNEIGPRAHLNRTDVVALEA